MGRRIQIRPTYNPDAAYLTRLETAVAMDSLRPADWRTQVMSKIREVAVLLLTAPPRREREIVQTKVKSGKPGKKGK